MSFDMEIYSGGVTIWHDSLLRRRHGRQEEGPVYVSAKRTQFISACFLMYHTYQQLFMTFAVEFANGFVLEKRTHFGGLFEEKSPNVPIKSYAGGLRQPHRFGMTFEAD